MGNPGKTPFYAPGSRSLARGQLKDLWEFHVKKYAAENCIDEGLILRFYNLFDEDIAQDLQDNMFAIANSTFIQVMDRAATKWGIVTPAQRITNRNRLVMQ